MESFGRENSWETTSWYNTSFFIGPHKFYYLWLNPILSGTVFLSISMSIFFAVPGNTKGRDGCSVLYHIFFLVCIFHTRCSLQSQSWFYNDPNQDSKIMANCLYQWAHGKLNQYILRVVSNAQRWLLRTVNCWCK